jgi:hypothetical protein
MVSLAELAGVMLHEVLGRVRCPDSTGCCTPVRLGLGIQDGPRGARLPPGDDLPS